MLGKVSDGQVDHDGDIVSPAWMADAVQEWLKTYPAVRVQHRPDYPAGRGLEAWQDNTGATWVKSLIVDPQAKVMVRKGVLRAYSVGIREPVTRKSASCPRFEIVGGRLTECSLVDSPSNARCGVQICKGGRYTQKVFGKAPKPTKLEKALSKGDFIKSAKIQFPAMKKMLQDQVDYSRDPAQREWARQALELL